MARYDDDDFDRPVKKRRRKDSADPSKLTGLIAVLIALFVSGVLVLLSFLGFSGPIFWICLIAYFIAQGWILMIAAADDTTQLMLCLFVPFYGLIYTIMNWSETKWAFCLGSLATFTLFASVVAGVMREAKEMAEQDRMDGVANVDDGDEEPWDEEPPEDPAPRRPRRGATPQQPPAQPKVTPQTPAQPPAQPPVSKKDEPSKLEPSSLAAPYDVDPQAKAGGQKMYLTALTPFAFQNSPWKLGIGAKGEGGKDSLQFNKQAYRYGVCMHPPMKHEGACRASFVPGKEFRRFKGWVGISGETNPSGQVLFAAYGDGRRLWESESITKTATWNRFDLDITNVKVLTLETRMKDGVNTNAHAAWLDPWLER